MSESVEQAARVAGWKARASREAAAIIDETGFYFLRSSEVEIRTRILNLIAIGWLQGASFGAHDTLDKVDQAFGLTKAEL